MTHIFIMKRNNLQISLALGANCTFIAKRFAHCVWYKNLTANVLFSIIPCRPLLGGSLGTCCPGGVEDGWEPSVGWAPAGVSSSPRLEEKTRSKEGSLSIHSTLDIGRQLKRIWEGCKHTQFLTSVYSCLSFHMTWLPPCYHTDAAAVKVGAAHDNCRR